MKLEDILSKSHIDLAVNTLSEDEPQLLPAAPVKNTFLHFDDAPPCAPAELLRLHTCPAEVGMSYFFERIGRSPGRAVSSTACVAAPKPFKMLERSCSAVKSVSWAPTQESLEEEEVKPAEEKREPEEEKEPRAADEALGEFFTVKKGKKRRGAGARGAAPPKEGTVAVAEQSDPAAVEAAEQQPAPPTEPAALEDQQERRSSPEALDAPRRPRWVDLESDDEEPMRPADLEEANNVEEESSSTSSVAVEEAPRPRPRWVDLESDDEEAMMRPAPPVVEKPAAPRGVRPSFSRPGREARMRQARADAAEICALEFDAVDASSQNGLVGRMLVMLKSLAQQVVFWEKAEEAGAEEKREEEKFRLLGLEEDDMYAIGRHIRKADKRINDRQFREAFNEMCEARRWLQDDPEWIAAQRARRAEKALREPKKETRMKKTEVKEEQAAPVEADDEDEWQTVGGAAAEKKKRKTAPEKTTITSCATAARTTARAAGTNGRPTRCAAAERQQQQQPPAPAAPQPARQAAAPSRPAVERRYPAAATTSAAAAMPPREGTKFLCRFTVGIEAEVKGGFRVCRRIFGPGGENMKSIARETNAKLRLRGRGSGFKEGPELREADEPLLLCVSAEDPEGYRKAVQSVSALFERIYQDYRVHCEKHRLPLDPELTIRLQEHPGNPRS